VKPLNHKKIEEDEIIERYVMRRLSPEETEAFEEHLFGCGECFEKVKLTEKAISGIREAAKQGLLEEKRHRSLHVFRERSKQLFTFYYTLLSEAFSLHQDFSVSWKHCAHPGLSIIVFHWRSLPAVPQIALYPENHLRK